MSSRKLFLLSFVLIVIGGLALMHKSVRLVNATAAETRYGVLPMTFEENAGQADDSVKFLARGHGYQVLLEDKHATLRLQAGGKSAPEKSAELKIGFSAKEAEVVGLNPLRTKSNYFIGNDETKWLTGIQNYARVEYRNTSGGVDVAFYGTQRSLEYDLIVAPGEDPASVAVTLAGAEKIETLPNGDLRLVVAGSELIQRAPVTYQTVRGKKRQIKSAYVLRGENRIGFAVDDYDTALPLVIDPVIDYSSFFGGIGSDEGLAIAVDNSGSAYITGTTYSNNFNTALPLQTVNRGGKYDAFVAKLNQTGTEIVYSTYLGGSAEDSGQGIAVDALGNAYVTGITNSTDFNTRNPFQATISGQANDAFVAKLNPQGSALVYSSYLGGSGIDQGFAIAVDVGGNVYLTGSTSSSDFPLQSPFQATNRGGADAYVAKLNAAGTALVYSSFIGGSSLDEAYAIAVDVAGNAVIAGGTASTDFNVANAVQTSNRGTTDAFVAKVNVNGAQLIYSTYLGGGAVDTVYGLKVDAVGNVYLAGNTFSNDFPLANAFQTTNRGNSDAFVAKLSENGRTLLSSSYYGGTNADFARGVGLDAAGQIYVAGRTASTDLTTVSALQNANRGNEDAFVFKLNSAATQLLYSTYLGGAREDFAFGIAVDNAGNAYVTGDSRSTDFNTRNPLQAANRGGYDAFVSKLNPAGSDLVYSTYVGGAGEDLGLGIALDTSGNAYITGYTSSNDYATRNPLQPTNRGGLEVFVTKILADNNDVAFNTYFGGNGSDTGFGIAVDGSGNAFVAGATTSTNLPLRNPLQSQNAGGLEGFVAKFNASGSTLVYSTYLGGDFGDEVRAVAVDISGNAYLAGSTFSENFPSRNAVQATPRGLGDAFIAKLDSTGSQLLYATFLGGSAGDAASDLALDSSGNVYVVGETFSTDFNTRNPLQSSNRGQQDGFAAKLSSDGSQLVYSTYLGGRRVDLAEAVAVDQSGNAYIAGSTASNDFPVANAFQGTFAAGGFDAFVTKLNPQGSQLLYSTFLGGSLIDTAAGIAVDAQGSAFITGLTNSLNFPRQNPLQADNRGGNDAFVTRLSPAGNALFYSTYLGGSADDSGGSIAVDARGTAYLTGATASPDFNIQFPLFAYGGGTDIFVAKILPDVAVSLAPAALELQTNSTGTLTLTLSPPQSTSLTVTLSSSNLAVAAVPANVTVPANTSSTALTVSALSAGSATITATTPASAGGASASSVVNVTTASTGGLEADVSPRPTGNGSLSIADWVQVGRFAAGFDNVAAGGEFQRADCAPRDARGNGAISIADWVQAGRYAAGLDAPLTAGGPTTSGLQVSGCGLQDCTRALPPSSFAPNQSRALRIVNTQLAKGQPGSVVIEMDAQGNENGIGFSVSFDATQLTFVNASLSSDAGSPAFNVNATQAASGKLGMALAYSAGQSMAAGKRQLFTLRFNVASDASASTALNFSDAPVAREVVNPNAETLTTTFTNASVALLAPVASVSAASYSPAQFAPEQIVAAFGVNLAASTQVANTIPLPMTLAGTSVTVRDSLGVARQAPLFFVSSGQVNYLMPAGTANGTATVTVSNSANVLSLGSVTVAPLAPGLFTANASGQGVPAATLLRVRADGSLSYEPVAQFNSTTNQFVPLPIEMGPESDQVFLLLFGTGIRGRSALSAVNARVANITTEALFAGAQGDLVGLDQLNLRLPRTLIGRGEVTLDLIIDNREANSVRIAVK